MKSVRLKLSKTDLEVVGQAIGKAVAAQLASAPQPMAQPATRLDLAFALLCQGLGTTPEEMRGSRRDAPVTRLRRLLLLALRQLEPGCSLRDLGRLLGRDHTSIGAALFQARSLGLGEDVAHATLVARVAAALQEGRTQL